MSMSGWGILYLTGQGVGHLPEARSGETNWTCARHREGSLESGREVRSGSIRAGCNHARSPGSHVWGRKACGGGLVASPAWIGHDADWRGVVCGAVDDRLRDADRIEVQDRC